MGETIDIESLIISGTIIRSSPVSGILQLIQGQKWQIATHETTQKNTHINDIFKVKAH